MLNSRRANRFGAAVDIQDATQLFIPKQEQWDDFIKVPSGDTGRGRVPFLRLLGSVEQVVAIWRGLLPYFDYTCATSCRWQTEIFCFVTHSLRRQDGGFLFCLTFQDL